MSRNGLHLAASTLEPAGTPLRAFALGRTWLIAVTFALMLTGAFMVLAPEQSRAVVGRLLWGSADALVTVWSRAQSQLLLLTSVMGAILMGWSVALLGLLWGSLQRPSTFGWRMLAWSLLAWFLPAAWVSISSGVWQNAVVTLAFVLLYAPGMWLTKPAA